MSETPKKEESKVEISKRNSRHLRGTIAEGLSSDATHFPESDVGLLKFHGTYEQDDRDVRQERRKQKQEEAYQFMVRMAIPAGVVTADQYLTVDTLADTYANGTLRVTTRQGFQLHGVQKKNLKRTIAGINQTLLTTLSACGDVERNVMACPAPLQDETHVALRRVAREIAVQLRPASRAYHEIWLDGEKQISTEEEEPFYGDTYLPRKFKTGVAMGSDNCVDIYSYDAGLVTVVEDGVLSGFNVLAAGGMGMTHGKADTMARLAEEIGYVEAQHGVETVRTIAAIFRDFGNRADRRHARLKYLMAEWGVERFREEFRRRVSFELAPWRRLPAPRNDDHLGRYPQGEGKFFYGICIANGRIIDRPDMQLKTALKTIAMKYRPGFVLTPHQNILLTDLQESTMDEIERVLTDHGVTPFHDLSAVRRHAMACPALPTCGLAMAESERLMPTVVDRFEAALTSLGLRNEPISMRMTGCPNGCARPYTADIAFVGRRPDVYHVYVGGGMAGNRVVDLYATDIATEELVNTLHPLLSAWASRRQPGEGLSDFYRRLMGHTSLRQEITGREEPTQPLIQLSVSS